MVGKATAIIISICVVSQCFAAEPTCHRLRCRTTLFDWVGIPADTTPHAERGLITDRPDFTEASSPVGLGVSQFELGYTYSYDDATTFRGHTYPEVLLRQGFLAEWLELRVGWTMVHEETSAPANVARGPSDLYLGFKLALTDQAGWLPEMALMPQMFVPSGDSDITSDEVLPGVSWLYGWGLTENLSLTANSQINRAVDPGTGNSYTALAHSMSVAATLTECVGAYFEWFVIAPHAADSVDTEHFINGGFTYAVGEDLQFDVRAGQGLSDAAVDYFVGAGFVYRFR